MFDTTLPDGVYAKLVKNPYDIRKFLVNVYADNADSEYDEMPIIENNEYLPVEFPCVLLVRWAGKSTVEILCDFNIHSATNLTYELVGAGAKLGDVIGTV
jgi:hypothetical protein